MHWWVRYLEGVVMDWRSLEAGAGTTDPNGPEDTRPGTQSRFSSSSSRRSHNYLGLLLLLKQNSQSYEPFFGRIGKPFLSPGWGKRKSAGCGKVRTDYMGTFFFGVEWCRQIFLTGAHPMYRKVVGFREIYFVTSQSKKA